MPESGRSRAAWAAFEDGGVIPTAVDAAGW